MTNVIEYFNKITNIVIDISSFDEVKTFKYISSLSNIQQYSYVKIENLKNSTDFNMLVGQVVEPLENNRFKIYINNKYISVAKKNIVLYPIILYFKCLKNNFKLLSYYNTAFNVPICHNKDLIIICYKGDYIYDNDYNLTPAKLDSFFSGASYSDYTVCNICNEEKFDLIACDKCIYTYCHNCVLNFDKKQCPYCKHSISISLKI
jgi:hypothetical protein